MNYNSFRKRHFIASITDDLFDPFRVQNFKIKQHKNKDYKFVEINVSFTPELFYLLEEKHEGKIITLKLLDEIGTVIQEFVFEVNQLYNWDIPAFDYESAGLASINLDFEVILKKPV